MPRGRRPNQPGNPNQHYPNPDLRVIDEGEMTVTGRGHALIDKPLRRSRALLIRSEEAVFVGFSENDPPCPPCAGEAPDELEWEVLEKHRQLFLRIKWRVNCARTIIWKIFEVR